MQIYFALLKPLQPQVLASSTLPLGHSELGAQLCVSLCILCTEKVDSKFLESRKSSVIDISSPFDMLLGIQTQSSVSVDGICGMNEFPCSFPSWRPKKSLKLA